MIPELNFFVNLDSEMDIENLQYYQPITFAILTELCTNIFSLIGFFQFVNILIKNPRCTVKNCRKALNLQHFSRNKHCPATYKCTKHKNQINPLQNSIIERFRAEKAKICKIFSMILCGESDLETLRMRPSGIFYCKLVKINLIRCAFNYSAFPVLSNPVIFLD